MVSFNVKAMGGAAAVYLLAQQCQCPPLAVPLFISAAAQVAAAVGSAGAEIAGAVIAANAKRSGKHGGVGERQVFTAPPGVPQFEFDRCTEDLAQESVSLYVQGPVSNNGVQVDGLPPTCMNLAAVLDGDAVGGPVPIPCGSACILYDNLSAEDYETMRTTFESARNA
ncbi:hypothetical protein UCREL1_4567 [Eutypa lata UCREL1]|uniref:Uncharacterized protein n=1 Tax=Eutypa lata (strain UCR-EL1) TaxID=1287681 RepID=M7SVU9_EUTLA|nr:hypothetical protein UCREL1_4567 [Eutypa lata UCREL1]